jgi:hypothetical protein
MTPSLELSAGSGSPTRWVLQKDIEVIIGTAGDWVVNAHGMIAQHLSVYFDGQKLFAMRHDPLNTAFINGVLVSDNWTEVPEGAQLEVAGARLRYLCNTPARQPARPPVRTGQSPALAREDVAPDSSALITQFMPPVQQQQRAALSHDPTEPPPESERTRFAPIAVGQTPFGGVPPIPLVPFTGAGPIAQLGGSGVGPTVAPTMVAPNIAPTVVAPNAAPAVAPPSSHLATLKADWQQMNTLRKILVLSTPILAMATAILLFPNEDPPPRRSVASASPSLKASAPTTPSVVVPSQPTPVVAQPLGTPLGTPLAQPPGTPPPSALGPASAKTRERLAADAYNVGDLGQAARMYEEMGDPQALEIARILRRKSQAPR